MRITCRYIRENALLYPPTLNEDEGMKVHEFPGGFLSVGNFLSQGLPAEYCSWDRGGPSFSGLF